MPNIPREEEIPEEGSGLSFADTLKGLLTGASRGLTTDAIGSSVDTINMLLGATGLPVSEEPFGGSKHIRGLTNQPKEDTGTEAVGNLLSALVNPSTAITKALTLGPMLGGMMVGKRAKGVFDEGLAKSFEELEKAGKGSKDLWAKTGTERGPLDRKLRQEISDLPAELKRDIGDLPYHYLDAPNLPDVLDHPELFKAYPELADWVVRGSDKPGAAALPKAKMITMGQNIDDPLSTLLHEIQHGVQSIEDFAQGGSSRQMAGHPAFSEEMARLPTDFKGSKNFLNDLLYSLYMRLGGEAEARNVSARLAAAKKVGPAAYDLPPSVTSDRPYTDLLWPTWQQPKK